MYAYKVEACLEPMPHDWATCPQTHFGEKAARRCPRAFKYTAMRCPQANKKLASGGRATCPKGDACGSAHSVYELWLHPDRFRTQMCLHGNACTKPLCFFAHNAAELRTATGASEADHHGSGQARPDRDEAEVLVQLHATVGGGRFSLAAGLAEVQLRQRQMYGRAGPGRALPRAPLAATCVGAMGPLGLQGTAQLPGLLGAMGRAGALGAPLLPGGFGGHDLLAAGLGADPLQLLRQQLCIGDPHKAAVDAQMFAAAAANGAALARSAPASLGDMQTAAAAAAAAAPWGLAAGGPLGGLEGASPPGPGAAAAALMMQMGLPSPETVRLPAAASAGMDAAGGSGGSTRRNSFLWPMDALDTATAASRQLPQGIEGAFKRTDSASSAGSLMLQSMVGGADASAASSFSISNPSDSPVHGSRSSDGGCGDGDGGSRAAASMAAVSSAMGACHPAEAPGTQLPVSAPGAPVSPQREQLAHQLQLAQQIGLLQLEQERAALKLQVLQLQWQQENLRGLLAGPAAGAQALGCVPGL